MSVETISLGLPPVPKVRRTRHRPKTCAAGHSTRLLCWRGPGRDRG